MYVRRDVGEGFSFYVHTFFYIAFNTSFFEYNAHLFIR